MPRPLALLLVALVLPACSRSLGDTSPDAVATAGSTVVVDYVGTLVDGTEFDRGRGVAFPLQSVVPGFRDGIVGMHPGEAKTIVVPPEAGYGAGGVPGVIPPGATLTFEVTLRSVR